MVYVKPFSRAGNREGSSIALCECILFVSDAPSLVNIRQNFSSCVSLDLFSFLVPCEPLVCIGPRCYHNLSPLTLEIPMSSFSSPPESLPQSPLLPPSQSSHAPPYPDSRFNSTHWLLLFLLVAVQFTHILDFVILMPLGTRLQEDIGINAPQFGTLVSAYGFAACLAGLFLAPLLDRFDRKFTLLVLYAGFTLGTLLCAVAPNFLLLLVGRAVAGGFGGVVASVVLAIVADAFPPQRRGTAMGAVMSAFSIASIVGVPIGLSLANSFSYGWRTPFAVLVILSVVVWILAWVAMPQIRGHLEEEASQESFWSIATRPAHLRAFVFMFALVQTSFLVVPFIAPFMEKTVGMHKEDVPWVYIVGGVSTLFTMNLMGRLTDRYPKITVFRISQLLTVIPILWLTHLPAGTGLALSVFVTTLFMVLTSSRMVPATTMMSSIAEPRVRGQFTSLLSAVQQAALSVAAFVAGWMLTDAGEGQPIIGFERVGYLAFAWVFVCLILVDGLQPTRSRRFWQIGQPRAEPSAFMPEPPGK